MYIAITTEFIQIINRIMNSIKKISLIFYNTNSWKYNNRINVEKKYPSEKGILIHFIKREGIKIKILKKEKSARSTTK